MDLELAKKLLKKAYDHGVNFFDNAEVYAGGKAEEIMGQAIKQLGWKRSDLVISTKIFWGGPVSFIYLFLLINKFISRINNTHMRLEMYAAMCYASVQMYLSVYTCTFG